MPDWSKLPDDLIASIISLLPLQDYVRFGAVCRSWCSVTKQKNQRPATQAPWMLLSDTAATNTRTIYSLYEEKLYNMDLPDLYGRRCCGSSHGWLVTIDDDLVVHLCHPFSKARIQLPALPDWTKPSPTYLPTRPPYRDVCIYKVVTSADPSCSEDYSVMALLKDLRTLALWRPGNFGWINIQTPMPRSRSRVEDAIWYDGKFYAINCSNKIIVVDPCSDPIMNDFQLTFNLSASEVEVERLRVGRQHLVDFMGQLLVVLKFGKRDPDFEGCSRRRYLTVGFKLFKVDMICRRMDPLDALGDYAVFLGTNQSIAISACKFKGCRKNCIYFTGGDDDWPFVTGNAGIYNLSDGTVEPFCPNDIFSPIASATVWFEPNPW